MPPVLSPIGALIAGIPLQYFGRKKTLIGTTVPSIAAFWLMGFTFFGQHKVMLYIGRILSGLMIGISTPASQIYVSWYRNCRWFLNLLQNYCADQWMFVAKYPWQVEFVDGQCTCLWNFGHLHHRRLCGMARFGLDPRLLSFCPSGRNDFHARNSRLAPGSRSGRRSPQISPIFTWKVSFHASKQ